MRLVGLEVADAPDRWEALGFALEGEAVDLGGVRVRLGRPGRGIVAWAMEPEVPNIDGLASTSIAPGAGATHPNGAVGIDHVVVVTPDFDRTALALEAAGLQLRRVRDAGGFRQGFRRLGPAILELVEASSAPPGPARFWGLVIVVRDLDALAAQLGDRLGRVKDAVQPGRRIATLRESAGLAPAVAFMDPEPERG